MTELIDNLWHEAKWPAPKHIRAGVSVRTEGYSKAPYDKLNLAQHVGDDPNRVKKNRATLSCQLRLQSEPYWLNQTHSANIVCIDNPPENKAADASFATQNHNVCVVMTADCVPILLTNHRGTKVAAVHAGWRGICRGIIENSLRIFSAPETIIAWLGPYIHKEYYEIGKDVYESCVQHSVALKGAFEQTGRQHWHADLGKIAKILLKNSGVDSIHECGLCTYKMAKFFYSYRRDGKTGRTAAMIWME